MSADTKIGLPARSLVVVPRLPPRSKNPTGNPFTSDGDIVVDCAVSGCGWHAMGPRADIGLAVAEHNRLFHQEEIGVVLLNTPGQ